MRDTLSGNGPGDCSPALPLQLPQPGWERPCLGYSKVVVGLYLDYNWRAKWKRKWKIAYIWVVMESQMEKKMEHEMETLLGLYQGYIGVMLGRVSLLGAPVGMRFRVDSAGFPMFLGVPVLQAPRMTETMVERSHLKVLRGAVSSFHVWHLAC